MKIGLMGGTFDPIHFGHLFIAEQARVRCELDEVWFVPNNTPAHIQGKSAYLTPLQRLELCELGVAGNPYFRVSRVEVEREGKSYAFDTINQVKAQTGAELFWILGGDAIAEVLTWHRGAELFDICRFVAASRPGFPLQNAKEALNAAQASRVEWMEIPGLHIASRDLRERIKNGEPIRYLVPDAVRERIELLNLYQ
ncbi:nicotinate-nucleotide adenylyltransferase [bacterium]|nr:MAG: nicotinate-nucleotide adenylyltransferase [bacterium]